MFTDDRHHGFDETEMINLLNQQRLREEREREQADEEEYDRDSLAGYRNREKGFDFEREI